MKNPLGKFAEPCRQLLTAQRITDDGPGTILRDIQSMIEFIGTGGVATGSRHGNLPPAALPELNARISQPVRIELKRPLLRDYPNLAGLFVLLRVMDLARVGDDRLTIDEDRLALWSSLNPTEKYFALLEAWLLDADEEVIGPVQRRSHFAQCSQNLMFLMARLSSRWQTFHERCHISPIYGVVSAWNIQLQARFGLMEAQPRPLEGRRGENRGWIMEKGRRTPWGEAVTWAVAGVFTQRKDEDSMLFFPPEDADFGWLQPAFQPFFPEWKNVWAGEHIEEVPGTYAFKVTVDRRCAEGGIWRRLAVPHHVSLDGVAAAVLDSFKFDDDHLYEFRFQDRHGKTMVYNRPFTDDPPFADEITVGECGLREKETMIFHFDFGDDWIFHLRLERIEPPDKKLRRPRVIESHGKPPKQYPYEDEE